MADIEATAAEADDATMEMPKAVKKKGAQKKQKTQDASSTPVKHPTYMQMILHAIENLNEKGGSSRIAIEKFIHHEYNIDKDQRFKTSFSKALKSGLEQGSLKQIKNSFKKATAVSPKRKAKKSTPAKAHQNKSEAKEKKPSTPKGKKGAAKPKAEKNPVPAEKASATKASNKKAANSTAPKKVGRPKKTAEQHA